MRTETRNLIIKDDNEHVQKCTDAFLCSIIAVSALCFNDKICHFLPFHALFVLSDDAISCIITLMLFMVFISLTGRKISSISLVP